MLSWPSWICNDGVQVAQCNIQNTIFKQSFRSPSVEIIAMTSSLAHV